MIRGYLEQFAMKSLRRNGEEAIQDIHIQLKWERVRQLYDNFTKTNVNLEELGKFKSSRLRWTDYIARLENSRNTVRVLTGNR